MPEPSRSIEDFILSLANSEWQKTAMLLAKTMAECQESSLQVTYEELANRVVDLVRQGRLQAQGDLSQWRNSEVRLPSEAR